MSDVPAAPEDAEARHQRLSELDHRHLWSRRTGLHFRAVFLASARAKGTARERGQCAPIGLGRLTPLAQGKKARPTLAIKFTFGLGKENCVPLGRFPLNISPKHLSHDSQPLRSGTGVP